MRQENFDRDWEAASRELLTGMKEWRLEHRKATLEEIEQELDKRMRRLRKDMLEDVAQASDLADVGRLAEEERPVCPKCGARLGPRGQKRRRLTTAGDEVLELTRSYAVCPECQTGVFPPG
jgi:hypothetical protein